MINNKPDIPKEEDKINELVSSLNDANAYMIEIKDSIIQICNNISKKL